MPGPARSSSDRSPRDLAGTGLARTDARWRPMRSPPSNAGLTAADFGQEPQLRQLLLRHSPGAMKAPDGDRPQAGGGFRGMGRKGLPRPNSSSASCSRNCRRCATSTTPISGAGTPATCCGRTTAASPCCRISTPRCSSCAPSRMTMLLPETKYLLAEFIGQTPPVHSTKKVA